MTDQATKLPSEALVATARAAGLGKRDATDLQLLTLVDPNLAPTDAVRILFETYPEAFAPDIRKMTREDAAAAYRVLLVTNQDMRMQAWRERLAAEHAKGSVRDLPRDEWKRREAEMLRAVRYG